MQKPLIKTVARTKHQAMLSEANGPSVAIFCQVSDDKNGHASASAKMPFCFHRMKIIFSLLSGHSMSIQRSKTVAVLVAVIALRRVTGPVYRLSGFDVHLLLQGAQRPRGRSEEHT